MALSQEEIDGFLPPKTENSPVQIQDDPLTKSGLSQSDIDGFDLKPDVIPDEEIAKENISASFGTNGDEAAQLQSQARDLGLPEGTKATPEVISEATKKKQKDELNQLLMSGRMPMTATFYKDRANADIGWDDVEQMGAVEKAVVDLGREIYENPSKVLRDKVTSFGLGSFDALEGGFGAAEASLDLYAEGIDSVLDMYLGDSAVGQTLKDANPATALSGLYEFGRETMADTKEYWMPKSDSFIDQTVNEGMTSAGASTGFAMAGIYSGMPHITLPAMAAMTYGKSYGTAKDKGLDMSERYAYALSHAGIEYVTEKIPVKHFMEAFNKGGKGFKDSLMKTMVSENIGEQAATVAQNAIDKMMLPENADKTWSEFRAEIPENALKTVIATVAATGAQTTIMSGAGYMSQRSQLKADQARNKAFQKASKQVTSMMHSEQDQAKIDQLIELSQNGLLNNRDPQRFEKFVAGLQENEQMMYVPADVIQDFEDLPDYIESQIDGLGYDVEIPVSKFMSDIVKHEGLLGAIRPHVKLKEDGYSLDEIERGGDNAVKEMIAQANATIEERTQLDEGYEKIRADLINTGVVPQGQASANAELIKQYVSRVSKEHGISIAEGYEKLNVTMKNPDDKSTNPAKQIDQAQEEGYEGQDQSEAKEWLAAKEKFGEEGMTPEARMARAKGMGFDTDQVYYHGTRRDFDEFEPMQPIGILGNEKGVYFTKDKRTAEEYAMDVDGATDDKSRIVEVYLKDPKRKEGGYGEDEFIITDPSNIRSVNAAFDPDYSDSSKILAQEEITDKDLLKALIDDFEDTFTEEQIAAMPDYFEDTALDPQDPKKPSREEFRGEEDKGFMGWSNDRIQNQIKMWAVAHEPRSRAQVAYVDPIDFVYATTDSPERISNEAGDLDMDKLREEVSQTPFLYLEDGVIVGHEGRHRLMAMSKAGYTKVPIVIVDQSEQREGEDLPKYKAEEDAIPNGETITTKGQNFGDGFMEDIDINYGRLMTFENAEAIGSDMSGAQELFQPNADQQSTNLPTRLEISSHLMESYERTKDELMNIAVDQFKNHDELYVPAMMTDLPMNVRTAVKGIDDAVLIYSNNPEVLATVWDRDNNVHRIIRGKAYKVSDDIKDGQRLSEAEGLTLNILSRVFNDIRDKDPAVQEKQRVDKLRGDEIRRRQNRLKDIPEMPHDFDTAIQELADWAENKEEFKQALAPDMMDISDRNLTRLGRATMALEPDEYEQADRGEVTIYRAMPDDQEIEAGDWVSFSEEYAAGHESNVGESGAHTVGVEVDGKDVWWYGADENEWVYIPEGTWGNIESVDELWDSLTDGSKPDKYPTIEGQTFYQSDTLQSKNEGIDYNHAKQSIDNNLEQWSSAFNINEGTEGRASAQEHSAHEAVKVGRSGANAFISEEDAIPTLEEGLAEQEKLVDLAKEKGFFVEPDGEFIKTLTNYENIGGMEHAAYVIQGEESDLVIRETLGDGFGHGVEHAPSDYLKRLERYNSLFPHHPTVVIGVTQESSGAVTIFSAQPYVEGEKFANDSDLDASMRDNGWFEEGVAAKGKPKKYRHNESGAVISDVTVDNILHADGSIYPIDIIVEEMPEQAEVEQTLNQSGNITTPEDSTDTLSEENKRKLDQNQKRMDMVEMLANCLKKG